MNIFKSWARLFFSPKPPTTHQSPPGKNFQFAIYENSTDIEECTWYRLKDWSYPGYYLRWENRSHGRDWKISSPTEEDVVGVAYEGRADNFVILADQPEFKMYFEREPNNPYDPNAIKVMGTALADGQRVHRQIGYLSSETAALYKDEPELQVGNASVKLPHRDNGNNLSLKIQILERSKSWKSKQK